MMVYLKYTSFLASITFALVFSFWCGKFIAWRKQRTATKTSAAYTKEKELFKQERVADFKTRPVGLNQATRGTAYCDTSTKKEEKFCGDDDRDTAWAEALVHPLLLSHVHPRRVAVVIHSDVRYRDQGAAMLQQVLQHKTVEECVVIVEATDGMNENQTNQSIHMIPHDVRVKIEVLPSDASNWFVETYIKEDDKGKKNGVDYAELGGESNDKKVFDAIILNSIVGPDSLLLAQALHAALANNGILGGLVGSEREVRSDVHYEMIINLEAVGFYSLRDYVEESNIGHHCYRQAGPEYFFVATKRSLELSQWFASEAQIDLHIARRIHSRVIGLEEGQHKAGDQLSQDKFPCFFDGATMALYQVPSRFMENNYCQKMAEADIQNECMYFGLDPDIANTPASTFELRPATNPNGGRGVFAKQDIPSNVYIGIEDAVHSMLIMPKTWELIQIMAGEADDLIGLDDDDAAQYFEPMQRYVEGYAMGVYHYGEAAVIVDPGIFTFVNHGCNGTYQTDCVLSVTESTASVDQVPDEFVRVFYNPNLHRRHWVLQSGSSKLRQPLHAGTELLDNYLYLSQGVSLSAWEYIVGEMSGLCNGEIGLVSDYENAVLTLKCESDTVARTVASTSK